MISISKSSKIYVAGHNGMVGSACIKELKRNGYTNIIFLSSQKLDLRNQKKVEEFIFEHKPEVITMQRQLLVVFG